MKSIEEEESRFWFDFGWFVELGPMPIYFGLVGAKKGPMGWMNALSGHHKNANEATNSKMKRKKYSISCVDCLLAHIYLGY
jgi:hypothetical protein